MPQPDIEVSDDSINESEKETENASDGKFNLDDLPGEDSENIDEPKGEEKKEVPDKSEIAQKLKWREKYKQIRAELDEFKKTSDQKHEATGVPADEKEKAAWDAIDKRIREVFKNAREEERASEKQAEREFQDKLDEALEDYPEFSETEIMDICEEFECNPDQAVKILKRSTKEPKKKPVMHQPKHHSSNQERKPNDSKKSIWEIGNEIKRELKEMVK